MSDSDYTLDDETTNWFLGSEDCETCGTNDDEVEFDPAWDEDGVWSFSYRVGCYGGDQLLSTDEDIQERLVEMFEHLRMVSPEHWGAEQEAEVRELIQNIEDATNQDQVFNYQHLISVACLCYNYLTKQLKECYAITHRYQN